MQFLDRNGCVLHYQVIPAGPDKPALVFSNSLGTDFRIWRDVIVRLAGTFTILTYDMRGHGLSGLGDGTASMADHADDLAALMDAAGIESAFVCGLSAGGQVAQQLCFDHRARVRGLILCATLAKIADAETWNARIAAVQREGVDSIVDSLLPKWFTETFHRDNPAELAGYRTMVARQPVQGYADLCAAVRDFDMRERVGGIDVPTICVGGEQDGATTAAAVADFARAIPEARFELIKTAGHLLCVEQPQALSDIITAFTDIVLREG